MSGFQHSVFNHGTIDDVPAKSVQPSLESRTRLEISSEDETMILLEGAAAKVEKIGRGYRDGTIDKKQFLSQFAKVARVLQGRFPQDVMIGD